MQLRKLNISHLAALLLTAAISFFHWQEDPRQTITWDAFGYYLYLPQTFIHGDLRMRDDKPVVALWEKYKVSSSLYYYHDLENGNHALKYTMGMAILYSPAFLVAHGIAKASGHEADGLSPPYQYAILIWSLLISIAGIWLLRRVLAHFYAPMVVAMCLLGIGIGTNYYLHVMRAADSVMTHGYLFTGYALLLWLTLRWHAAPSLRRILPVALTCGLMILVRPSESVCLLIPLLWGVSSWPSLQAKLKLMWKERLSIGAFAGLLVLIGLPQFIYWKMTTGHFLHTAYGGDAGEGFDWLRPHVYEVLIGFRKGWLVYTPLAGLGLIGLVALYRQQRALFWPLIAYLVANVYWVSAWSCYWYAHSFGQRALIPALVLISLPLGALLTWAAQKGTLGRMAALTLLVACILLNLFQSYQYEISLLDGTRMTWPYYKAIWGKLGVPPKDKQKMLVNRGMPIDNRIEFPELYASRPYLTQTFDTVRTAAHAPRLNGSAVETLWGGNPYSHAISIPYEAMTDQDHVFVRISGQVYAPHQDDHIGLITHSTHLGKTYDYLGNGVDAPQGQWKKFEFMLLSPELRARTDSMRIYLWYSGTDTIYAEDIQIDLLTRKQSPE
jgi:hypothetical protein